MKSAMQNGLVMGAIFSVNFLFSVSGINALILFANIIPIAIVFILYKMSVGYRDSECHEVVSYGKAFLYLLLIFFYASLISMIVKYLYLSYIDTTFLDTLYQETMKMMDTMKLPVNTSEMEGMAEQMFKPLNYSLIYIWWNMFTGTFVSLILAAFIKKEKNIFQE